MPGYNPPLHGPVAFPSDSLTRGGTRLSAPPWRTSVGASYRSSERSDPFHTLENDVS